MSAQRSTLRFAAVLAAASLILPGCTFVQDTKAFFELPTLSISSTRNTAMVPPEGLGNLTEPQLAIALSQMSFTDASAAVLTGDATDEAALALARKHSIPLLILPEDSPPEVSDAVVNELRRLGTEYVFRSDLELPEAVTDVAEAVDESAVVRSKGDGAAGGWFAVVGGEAGGLEPLLKANGAQLITGGDPRAHPEVIELLAQHPDTPVATFGDEIEEWKWETARTGVQLPGGSQLIDNNTIYIAIYGHPGSTVLGILGEQGTAATIELAQDYAASYVGLTEHRVVPTLEIITTIASARAGADNDYSDESSPDHIRPLIEAAREAGLYVILDLQPGRTDFLTQAKRYEEFLLMPHVGLALDPEWRIGPTQVHLVQIGHVMTSEVNEVITWLADLTRDNRLPQKILVLHSFTTRMVREIETLDTSREELALIMHVDGQGGQGAKQQTWRTLVNYANMIPHFGWKNFIDEDLPMLTPEQTIEQVDPTPFLITYQ